MMTTKDFYGFLTDSARSACNAPITVTGSEREIISICKSLAIPFYTNAYTAQLAELKEILGCGVVIGAEGIKSNYVYFDWGQVAVYKIVDEESFYELITWRNKDKITPEEQQVLKCKAVSIGGCSVGSSAAKVLSKSGIAKFNIAELKTMKPSNSSRMYQDSIRNYGTHKLLSLVESMYEYNPYLDIARFMTGIDKENLDSFFRFNGRKVDIFIDAIDDPLAKLEAEIYCKKNRIPVVRAFDERGALVILRYDLYDTPLSVHLIAEELEELKKSDPKQYALKLVDFYPGGIDNISSRQKLTLSNIEAEVRGGFSQLAWEASLFASCVTKVSLDIVLGSAVRGTEFVDLDSIIGQKVDA